jgi:type II secretory pathway component GspD/PulD (secretin)
LINKFPQDWGQLREAYMGGGRNSDESKVVEEGWSGGGGEQPRIANSTLSSSLGMNSLVMTKHTHKIRTIQHINKRVMDVRMKMVEVSAMNILIELSGGLE